MSEAPNVFPGKESLQSRDGLNLFPKRRSVTGITSRNTEHLSIRKDSEVRRQLRNCSKVNNLMALIPPVYKRTENEKKTKWMPSTLHIYSSSAFSLYFPHIT